MTMIYIEFDLSVLSSLVAHLKYVKHATFQNCLYFDDRCLKMLTQNKDSLEYLEIVTCPAVTANGIGDITALK